MDTLVKSRLTVICEADCFQEICFNVTLYNNDSEIISTKKASNKEKVEFEIPYCGRYKIRAEANDYLSPVVAFRWVKLSRCMNCSQYFKFLKIKKPPRIVKVTFKLTDANYKNLPIQQGVINLWHYTQLP